MYSCETCNYDTSDKSNLNKHLTSKKHLDKINNVKKVKKVYTCPECEYQTTNKSNLNKHINCKHNDLVRKKYECLACKMYLDDERHLNKHKGTKKHHKNVYDNYYPEAFEKENGETSCNRINDRKSKLFIRRVNKLIHKSESKCETDDDNEKESEKEQPRSRVKIVFRDKNPVDNSERDEEKKQPVDTNKNPVKDTKRTINGLTMLDNSLYGMVDFKSIDKMTFPQMKKLITFTCHSLSQEGVNPEHLGIKNVDPKENDEDKILHLYGKCFQLMTSQEELKNEGLYFSRISKIALRSIMMDMKPSLQ